MLLPGLLAAEVGVIAAAIAHNHAAEVALHKAVYGFQAAIIAEHQLTPHHHKPHTLHASVKHQNADLRKLTRLIDPKNTHSSIAKLEIKRDTTQLKNAVQRSDKSVRALDAAVQSHKLWQKTDSSVITQGALAGASYSIKPIIVATAAPTGVGVGLLALVLATHSFLAYKHERAAVKKYKAKMQSATDTLIDNLTLQKNVIIHILKGLKAVVDEKRKPAAMKSLELLQKHTKDATNSGELMRILEAGITVTALRIKSKAQQPDLKHIPASQADISARQHIDTQHTLTGKIETRGKERLTSQLNGIEKDRDNLTSHLEARLTRSKQRSNSTWKRIKDIPLKVTAVQKHKIQKAMQISDPEKQAAALLKLKGRGTISKHILRHEIEWREQLLEMGDEKSHEHQCAHHRELHAAVNTKLDAMSSPEKLFSLTQRLKGCAARD